MRIRNIILVIGVLLVTWVFVFAAPVLNYISPSPNNDSYLSNTSVEFNVSIEESALDELIWNWNGTNYTLYDDSLVLMMNFDNVSALGESYAGNNSVILDVSNLGNNGTFYKNGSGSIWNSTGKYGGSGEFDGEGDWVDTGISLVPAGGNNYVVSVWFTSLDQISSHRELVAQWTSANSGNSFFLGVTSTDNIRFSDNWDSIDIGTWTTNDWHHLVAVSTSDNAYIYFDGILKATKGSALTYTGTGPIIIGKQGELDGEYWNGSIDEVRIYNRSLSAQEVYQLYASNLQKYNQTQWYLYVNQSKNATDTLTDATYTYEVFAKNDSGTITTTGEYSYTVDTINPTINFTFPTPANNSAQAANSIYVNYTVTDTNDIYSFIDFDDSLVLWMRMDEVNQTGTGALVYDNSSHCYDNETEILTENGWKLFSELKDDERVMTLNQETGKGEWQVPLERQEFNNSQYGGEMFVVKTVDSDGKKGKLVVSPEHRVYSSSKNFLSSEVLNTSTADFTGSSWKCSSFDQTGQLSFNANARYGASSGSDISDLAQFKNCGETLTFKLTNFDSASFTLSNLSLEIFSNSHTSSEWSSISSNTNLCEYRSKECSFVNFLVNESFFNKEKATLASITNFIYDTSDFLNLSLTDLANLRQSSSVILLSLVNFSSSSNSSAFSSCTSTSCFASSDQFTHENSFISDLSFSGTEKVTDGIYDLPPSSFFNCSILDDIMVLNISDHLIPGCLSILDLNSSGSDNVTVAIFVPLGNLTYNYVNEHKYVDVFKGFGLRGIKDVHSDFTDGESVWFMGEDQSLIEVKSIEKVDYSGKIYDVDVSNDVVLVRRCSSATSQDYITSNSYNNEDSESDQARDASKDVVSDTNNDNCLVVWSGNSNNGTAFGNAVQNSSGRFGKGFSFDGVGDYVDVGDDASLDITNNITVSAWINPSESGNSAYRTIFAKRPAAGAANYELYLKNDAGADQGRLSWWSGSEDSISSYIPVVGTWTFVAATISQGNNLTIYANGKKVYNGTTVTIAANDGSFGVGRAGDVASEYFNGSIDEVLIFNRSLDANEIEALYNASANKLFKNFTSLSHRTHTFTIN